MANMPPIPKVKNQASSNECKPIALTLAICKVIERIILCEILNTRNQLMGETNM